jgi:hypothetical protein
MIASQTVNPHAGTQQPAIEILESLQALIKLANRIGLLLFLIAKILTCSTRAARCTMLLLGIPPAYRPALLTAAPAEGNDVKRTCCGQRIAICPAAFQWGANSIGQEQEWNDMFS